MQFESGIKKPENAMEILYGCCFNFGQKSTYCRMFKYAEPSMIGGGSISKVVNTPPEVTCLACGNAEYKQALLGSKHIGYLLVLAATWMPLLIWA